MTTKEYLEQATGIQERIDSIRNQINSYPEKCADNGFITALEEQCEEYEKLRRNIFSEICRVPDNKLAALLIERYINGCTWEETTERLKLDDSDYVRQKLHNKALMEFEKNRFVKVRKGSL